ncbi:ion transporter, putative [Bodo saltans]|uniref:Ion transporter, putative n=1 Tax=Bodo saltans TaxID=75058 RepID=A0A0S4IWG6_BODSA|nr:ion transporter, putative [Bodo saltans]|eukprot:CUG05880.1 ion transporter, putative [Bodo saltans]
MPAATPTSHTVSSQYLSESDAKVFKRCELLQNRIVRARLWLSVLAVLSLLDAPAMVIQSDYVEYARFYSVMLALIAIPIIFHINWCKTLQFGFRHRVGALRLSLKGVSIFWMLRRTIYRNELIIEICMWLVFTPPYVHDIYEWTKLLDLGCFLRMYALLLYYGAQHYSSHVSCQALARLGRRHLNLHFVMASTLYSQPALFLATVIFVFWVASSLIFARLEGRDIMDSFYFVWVSCALIGYGDVYPRTFGGQVVAILCGSFSWIVLGFAMHPFSNTASGFRPRNNMYLIVIATA